MNRQTLMIGTGLLAAVIVVFGGAVYLNRSGSDSASAPVSGPGRAAEARELISEIESRRESGGAGTIERQATAPATSSAPAPTPAPSEPVNGGAVAVTPEPAAPAPTGANAELDAAYDRALELQAAGQLDDAQVLLFFGARRGHARSAFAYAEINDPNHHSPETSLLAEPDAFQAFRWYTAALEGGVDEAAERLDALHEWAVTAAAAGDSEAERLLLQWEQ
jgi:hypothetical protein